MTTQFESMQFAMEKFGIENEMENVVTTTNNTDIIENLIELYNEKNENYPEFETDADKTETENMFDFLNHVDDVDCGGISENFVEFE